MLLLGSKTQTIEGVTVFADHADPNQFWYLPAPVQLARRGEDDRAQFTFIKYKPAAVAGGAKGGGFLTCEVDLRLDPELRNSILGKVGGSGTGPRRLDPVPFDEGTVQCVALDLQGSGGTGAETAGTGTFNAVEQILGAGVPSLYGDNNAVFSLTLSQEGATIVEQAFEQGGTPIGVIYNLKFTGIRPALDVKITADLKRVYDQFSAGLSAQVYFLKAAIEAGFEKLVQEGAIKIEVTNFSTAADRALKERWALDFFQNQLLAQWFTPTLNPGQLAGGARPGQGGTPGPGGIPGPGTIPTVPGGTSPPPPPPGGSPGPTPTPGPGGPTPTPGPGGAPTPTSPTPTPAPAPGPGSPPVGTPSTGPQQASPAVQLNVKFIHQEELKTVTFEYHASEAEQRSYAPQGFFGLMVEDLKRKDHFIEVDLDDPFFRVFTVNATAPFDFDRIGLVSASVALDYGDRDDPAHAKHTDLVFDHEDEAGQKWEVFMSDLETSYRQAVEYAFDPDSGWEGESFQYEPPPEETEDRTLVLNPHQHLAFLDVSVYPNRMDSGVIVSTDVHFSYESPGGWKRERELTVRPDSQPQHIKLRLTDPSARSYSYRLVHHLKDGRTREGETRVQEATSIPVDDPFEGAIDLELIPLYRPGAFRTVFVDLEYDDPDNEYQRRERFELDGGSVDLVGVHLSVMDPKKRKFRYRVTYVGSDNTLQRGAFVETEETLVELRPAVEPKPADQPAPAGPGTSPTPGPPPG